MNDDKMFAPGEDIAELKTRFAEALLRSPDNAFAAGIRVFGEGDTSRALYVSARWINDPDVMAAQTKLLSGKGARAFLPTKEDYAREVWRLATNERTPVEDRARLLSLYGDVMGFKETAQKNNGGITINNNKVMMVRDFGTDANWEEKAIAQQHKLTQADNVVDTDARTLQ